MIVLAALLLLAAPREYVTDPQGRRLGYTEERGNRLEAYDRQGRRLGYYDSRTNKTYDRTGRIVSGGNTVVRFIPYAR